MNHVFWLRPNVVAGRPGPDTEPWDPAELVRGGIGAVLSLNDAACVEADSLAAAGIEYLCAPLSDAAPPEPGDLEICVDALPRAFAFSEKAIASGRPVLAHCRAGKDRTGMFLSYYLRKTEGLSVEAAIAEVKRVRPIAMTAQGFEDLTRDVLVALGV